MPGRLVPMMKCKIISPNLHKTRVLMIQFDLRPSKIFFPNKNLDNQPSHEKEELIDYECCPEDVLPPKSLLRMSP